MKIGFFELENWEKDYFNKAFPKDKLILSTGKITPSNVSKYKNLEVLSIFIGSKIDHKILDKLPKLKFISTRSTGFDHLDLDLAKEKKISVSNVPVYGANTVAEHTFALILALSKHLVRSIERTRRGNFSLKNLRGFDLKGKTIGLIGCGNIGAHVARMANGFEMKTIIYDLKKDQKIAKKWGFKYVSLNELIKTSDIISLHVPYNKHTHHLINKKRIEQMKLGVYIINTARGGIIDTEALLKGLHSKQIAGVGLDVLEEEHEISEERELLTKSFNKKYDLRILIENHLLLEMPNVLVTPHNAFNTNEALLRIVDTTIDNIRGFKKRRKVNLVK